MTFKIKYDIIYLRIVDGSMRIKMNNEENNVNVNVQNSSDVLKQNNYEKVSKKTKIKWFIPVLFFLIGLVIKIANSTMYLLFNNQLSMDEWATNSISKTLNMLSMICWLLVIPSLIVVIIKPGGSYDFRYIFQRKLPVMVSGKTLLPGKDGDPGSGRQVGDEFIHTAQEEKLLLCDMIIRLQQIDKGGGTFCALGGNQNTLMFQIFSSNYCCAEQWMGFMDSKSKVCAENVPGLQQIVIPGFT